MTETEQQNGEQIKKQIDSSNETISPSSTLSNSSVTSSATENAEGTPASSEQATAPSDENELILIQDSAYTIKMQVPGIEAFDLQVTSMELVQEIHQMVMDKEETCHRTCFSLQLDGIVLDKFSELKMYEGCKDGAVVKLVEEPYNVREVRLHVRHVNEMIHSIDPIDCFNGVNCSSLSYVNDVTNGDISDKTRSEPEQKEKEFLPAEYVMPNGRDVPILPLHMNANNTKLSQCIKQLTFTGFNPPPGPRKMKGDLMYLHIITMEDKRYHLTASTKGFFVNQSTDDVFNYKPDNQHKIHHSLVDLLNALSPIFKKNFSAIQKKRTQKHPFERIGTPFQVNSWLSPSFEHTVDWFRAEDSNAAKLGHEDHIPGHSRDWNEEIQATRELPKKTLPERLVRERAMFKVHSDFVNAATRGAMAVVESNIMAINPGEDSKIQMFIWNNMFFSLGFDVKDHYIDFGGDYAAYTAPINDLQGVKALNVLDIDGLHTLGTVVIDYKGFRVTAQSIIPGILDKDQEQSVVHGSTDFGKTCATNEKYDEFLDKVCAHLKMRPHKIKIEDKEELVMYSSIECKGIIGNDGRHYVLDLLRMFPSDLNYLPDADIELTEKSKTLSFPKKFRHKLCCLRQELIESFVDDKYVQFVKYAALQIQQLNKEKLENNKKSEDGEDKTEAEKQVEDAKNLMKELTTKTSADENSNQIIEKACQHVNSYKSNEFDIRFNPNLFQPNVKLVDDIEQLNKDKNQLKEACDFLLNIQIPLLIKDLLEHVIFITDGVTLCETLHSRGINIRYLGHLMQQISKYETLSYVHSIGVNELVSRSCKRVFKQYIQSVSSSHTSYAISHFLNCFLSNHVKINQSSTASTDSNQQSTSPSTNDPTEALTKSKKNRKKNQKKNNKIVFQDQSLEWNTLSPRSLWTQISEELMAHYHYDISMDSNEEKSFVKYQLRKLTLLRSFCQKNGVQLLLREYNFESKTKEAFHEEDILNMYPIVKHVPTKATDAYSFFTNGQTKIQQGYLKEGYELITEAYNLLTNVYGALHPEICMCLRLLSRLNYILGDFNEALNTQHKAVMMCERLFGVDHSQTITEYTHLALYCFANNQIQNSLKLLYRARYLLLIGYGEDHPEMGLIDSNIGLILQATSEYDSAVKFLESSLNINKKYFNAKSMKAALSYHLLARLQSCRGDFRTALMNERETYQIYKEILGEEHDRTKESAQVLKHLTEQAVLLQKKMNEMYKGQKFKFPPIQIQQPSMQTVLAMLNIINGILFVPTHEEEIDRIREELNRLQKNGTIKAAESSAKTETVESKPTQPDYLSSKPISVNAQDDDLQ